MPADDKSRARRVWESKETGIAEMTYDEWCTRASYATLETDDPPKHGEFAARLLDLGLCDIKSYRMYGAFADLMGFSDETIHRWLDQNKMPRFAVAFIQLAQVLKAAQQYIPKSEPAKPSTLLPKMPLPPHLRKE